MAFTKQLLSKMRFRDSAIKCCCFCKHNAPISPPKTRITTTVNSHPSRSIKIRTHYPFLEMLQSQKKKTEHIGNAYQEDILINFFLSALPDIMQSMYLVQWSVLESQWASGISLSFANLEKYFLSLDECALCDTRGTSRGIWVWNLPLLCQQHRR